ncbi:pectate lyase-like adhesive domain-containing protein, partial [Enterococcus mundtii]
MPSRLRRTMLFLGTTILVIQTVTIPLGMVYAETTMDNVEHEPMERPAIQNSLKELSSNPNFFFSQSQLQGTIKVPLQVTFFSDQEVSEARVILPEEATLIQDQLSAGISIEQGEQPHEWIVHSKHAQNTFVLPLVFDKIGNYELSVEETTTQLKISEPEAISDELPAEESDSPDDELGGQKESKEGEYIIEENQEDDQTSEEVDEPKEEAPQDQQTKEKEPFVSVSTWEEFQKAISNDDVQKIILENDIVRNAGSAGTINRNIEIDGQGWSIDFANNTAGFTLGAVSVETTITLKNITITKPGTTAIFTGTAANSQRWTLNFENVHTGSGNVSGLVNAPNAKAGYIGGENTYRSTMNGRDDAVFRVNKFFARNGSKVSMDLQAKLAQISGVLPVVQITDEDTTVSINTTSTSSGRNGGVIR